MYRPLCATLCRLNSYTVAGKAVGFAPEQPLHVVALAVFSYVDFKVASAYRFVGNNTFPTRKKNVSI
ncbi:MAG: hypothetical protein LBH59_02030 [Planctomycetaceae bacterium]|nr:hypothetical protein [Planctomycetaceae bacterium]